VIGPNNVGKTSLCSALRFVSLTASSDLETAAQNAVVETWNIANVYVKSPTLQFDLAVTLDDNGQSLDFAYSLVLGADREPQTKAVMLRAISERLVVTGGKFAQTVLLECKDGQARLLHEEQFLKGSTYCPETLSPDDATMLSRLYDLQSNRRANLFRRYLQSWMYFSLNPHALRSSQVVSDKPMIFPDGANMARVMFALHNERPRIEKKIIEALKAIEPKVDLFTFTSPDPKSVYLYLRRITASARLACRMGRCAI
jgi:predicted ATPase